MSGNVDLTQPPVETDEGQATEAPEVGTSHEAPEQESGQGEGAGEGGTSHEASEQTASKEETFFDASSLAPELRQGYDQMQAAFTKKMQGLGTEKGKIDAYNEFMADPVGQLQALARQHGMTITQAGTVVPESNGDTEAFEPKSWDDVFKKVESQMMAKFQGQMQPVFDNVQKLTTTNIEAQLDSVDPGWRVHEDAMMQNLKAHPTLVNNISMLYKMSVPDSVLSSKATQSALKSMDKKAAAAKMQGTRSVHKSVPVTQKVSNFNDAVKAAKKTGTEEGWYKP